MRIRILGGGVAGLAGAVALRHHGFDDVRVLERDTPAELHARPGHGMILMRNGVAALRALGAGGCLVGHRALTRAVFQDERGAVQRIDPLDGIYCVTRGALVGALRAELPDGAVEHGRLCANVLLESAGGPHPPDEDRRVRSIGFADGSSLDAADADLFVGADGVRSTFAAALNPDLARPHSRVFEIVMSARDPELAAHLGATFLTTLLAQRCLAFGLLSPSPGRVVGFLQFDVQRHGVPPCAAGPGIADVAVDLLGDVPWQVARFLRLADRSTAHLWRPADAEPAARPCVANAVLIGDAAHPLLPFSRQGVGAALDDALVLAEALARGRGEPLAGTLARYCEERRRDVAPFVAGGRRIQASLVGQAPGFASPYVHAAAAHGPEPAVAPAEDPLFADAAADLATGAAAPTNIAGRCSAPR
jgi:salicylate hydroxylase